MRGLPVVLLLLVFTLVGRADVAAQAVCAIDQPGCCASDVDCDDADVCNGKETCDVGTGTCGAGTALVCNDAEPCTDDACDPLAGCVTTNNTDPCSDGDACTDGDVCAEGKCVAGPPLDCSDPNPCTDDGCDPATGCVHQDNTAPCSDGEPCTAPDVCANGACVGGSPVVCDDNDPCTTDACVPGVGCQHVAVVGCKACDSAPECDDGNPCTDEACVLRVCVFTPNLDPCDDGNACTTGDQCAATVCVPGVPTVCAASDQCHAAGTCNPTTGACSNPARPDDATCDDGNACTQTDTCQSGTCTGTRPVVCAAPDQCHTAGTCNPATGVCTNPARPDDATCDDGNACTQTDTCQSGVCTGASPVVCAASDQCHTAGTCNPTTGVCTNPARPDDATCDDGNACTQTDTCQAGVCSGASPVVCTASDQCHTAGTCNPTTGVCTNPARANGTGCDDGNACTQTDTCQSGTCTGASPVVCIASDQCHQAGICNPATGTCSNPARPDDAACNDGNACTQTDTCQTGVCTGASPVVCTASDQCHTAGTCNPTTGVCTNPARPDDATCDDGNACTQTDTCQGGACGGANPVVCPAPDQCHTAGTCNPTTGICSNPAQPNGTDCDDGNACTQTDTCQSGTCTGASPVVCAASDQCHTAGTCNPTTGVCTNPAHANGTGCNDGNACTQTDTCQSGTCTGASPVVCTASDQCHTAGTCNPATGICSNPAQPNGTGCNDGNACTQTDTCQGGACSGANPVVCPAPDQCHRAGTCIPTTGLCTNPARPDDATCNDANACTTLDACQSGICTGGPPVDCADTNPCTTDSCNPASGCVRTNNTDPCSDNDACTTADRCGAGACVGGPALDCSDPNPCTDDTCNAATGCVRTNNTAPCDDGNACTTTDRCAAGACVAGPPPTCNDGNPCTDDSCNTATGCVRTNNTATCSDGDACTEPDVCAGGSCTAGGPLDCDDKDACTADACLPASGCQHVGIAGCRSCDSAAACDDGNPCTDEACLLRACQFTPNTDPCDDGNACTTGDQCAATACVSGAAKVCTALDQCHTAGTCDPETGVCSNPPQPNDTRCDDASLCTTGETCQDGVCTGTSLTCPLPDQCQLPGTCVPATGLCAYPPRPDNTPCGDLNACTRTDVCAGGVCTGRDPVTCPASDQCHLPGTCDTSSGLCSDPVQPDGTGCIDGSACTRADTCQTGTCVGSDPVVCTALDACHLPGECVPATGICTDPVRPDGATCDDRDGCTVADRCTGGACGGVPRSCDDGASCSDERCVDGECRYEVFDSRCDTGECILAHCRPRTAGADTKGCVGDPVFEGETCTDDGFPCTEDLCTDGLCRHDPIDSRCATGESCLPAACVPASTDADEAGCVTYPEEVAGDECLEDGDPCTDDSCTDGGCAHDPVPQKDTCDPVGPVWQRAVALAIEARSLSGLITAAITPAGAEPATTMAETLAGSAVDLASTFERVARILAGKTGSGIVVPQVLLASAGVAQAAPVGFSDTLAQQRARIAFTEIRRTPKTVAGFLRQLGVARERALLAPASVPEIRREGRDLLRGTKALKRDLKRIQRVSRAFAR